MLDLDPDPVPEGMMFHRCPIIHLSFSLHFNSFTIKALDIFLSFLFILFGSLSFVPLFYNC